MYSIIKLHPNSSRELLETCLQQFPKNLYLKFDPGFAKDDLTPGKLFEPSVDLPPKAYQELCETFTLCQAQKIHPIPKSNSLLKYSQGNGKPKKKKAHIDSPSIEGFFKPIDTTQSGSCSRLTLSGRSRYQA